MAFVKKYWFWGILISILTVFAMSYNVSAVNFDLSNYSLVRHSDREENVCRLQNGETAPSGLAICTFDSVAGMQLLKEIQTKNTFDLKQGDIIEFYLVIATQQNYNASGGTYFINEVTNANGLITLDYEAIDDYSSLDFVTFDNQMTYDTAYILYDFFANYKVAKVYRITQLVPSDGSYNLGLNIASNSNNRYIFNFIQSVQDVFYFSIKNFNVYRRAESQENKEVEEKTQGAVDDSQAAGSGSSSSASQGGANLLSAITGFFNVITSAQPSNCRFNAPLNTYFGNERLNVDLCALDLPSGIGALTSIIAIGILIPFAIHMFNKFIALFRSFQS